MIRHWLGLIILVLFLLTYPVLADEHSNAASGSCGKNVTWSLDSGVLTIGGTGAMADYYVRSLPPWDSQKEEIVRVIVGSGVTDVGNYAFKDCPNLSEASLPDSLIRLGHYSFYACRSLSEIRLPENLCSIGEYAFWDCDSLSDVTMPDSVSELGFGVFSNCDHLSAAVLSGGLAEIPYRTLAGCPLTSITIPEGVEQISDYAFTSCNLLEELHLPHTVKQISTGAFSGCASLADVYYPDLKAQAETIQTGTDNDPLVEAEWHCLDGFYDGKGPMSGTCGTNLIWELDNDGVMTIQGTGSMLDYITTTGPPWEHRKKNIVRVIVGDGVTSLGDSAFFNCINLTDVELPPGLIRLGHYCFNNCRLLQSICLPDGLRVIDRYVFYNCTLLQKVRLPLSLEQINTGAFLELEGLTDVYFPGTQESMHAVQIGMQNTPLIEAEWHYGCEGDGHCWGPVAYNWSEENTTVTATMTCLLDARHTVRASAEAVRSVIRSPDMTNPGKAMYIAVFEEEEFGTACKEAEDIPCLGDMNLLRLPAMLYTIENEACAGLSCEGIIIPEGCETIGPRAFAGCRNLLYVCIPASVTYISEDAFADCPYVWCDFV